MLANIHLILAYDVPGTEDVGLPTKFRLNVGPALQPIAGSMPVKRLRRWPNTKSYCITGSVVYFAQTRVIQPMLFQCLVCMYVCM